MPATVWTFDAPIPSASRWPTAVVERVLASFAPPGGTVVFINWPDPDPEPDLGSEVRSGRTGAESVGASRGGSKIESEKRSGLEPDTVDAAAASARAVGHRARVIAAPVTSTLEGGGSVRVMSEFVPAGSADLVITATPPEAVDDRRADTTALFAARALRAGGILAVLTHSDWAGGVLQDPTGTLITAGQSADLLYLQHVVAVHQPLAHNREQTTAQQPDSGTGRHSSGGHSSGRHQRAHSDVLVLVQPHDHALDLPNAVAA